MEISFINIVDFIIFWIVKKIKKIKNDWFALQKQIFIYLSTTWKSQLNLRSGLGMRSQLWYTIFAL